MDEWRVVGVGTVGERKDGCVVEHLTIYPTAKPTNQPSTHPLNQPSKSKSEPSMSLSKLCVARLGMLLMM